MSYITQYYHICILVCIIRIPREYITLDNKKLNFLLQVFFFCHQRPDRSFHYKGKKFPLCARCTGMAAGYFLSIFLLIIFGLFHLWMIALLILPMAIDGIGQLFNKWVSNNIRRFITGLFGGVGIIYIFYTITHQVFHFGQYVGKNL